MKKFLLIILVLCFVLITPKAVSAVTLTNTISVSVYPALLTIDEKANKVYAISFPTAMSIEVINGSTDTSLTTIPVDAGENASLSNIAVNSNTGTVYVSKSTSFESRDNKIFIIDSSSNMVTDEIITEPYKLSGHIALDQAANRIYVTSNNSVTGSINSVTAIDATSKAILHSIELMGSPGKMVVDSNKNRVYAINTTTNEVFVLGFDTNSNKLSLIATINIEGGGGPQSIALIPTINRLFVDSLNTEFVYVINTNTNEVIEKIPGRKKFDEVDSLGVNPKTNKLYVAYKGIVPLNTSDEIVVYDATTLALDDRVKLDFDFVEFFTNQTTNKVYVAASLNSTTPIYVLSDGSSTTSGGSSTSSGGTSTSSGGSIFLTNFLNAANVITQVVDKKIKPLKKTTRDAGCKESLNKVISKLTKATTSFQAIFKLPSIVCEKRFKSQIRNISTELSRFSFLIGVRGDGGEPCFDKIQGRAILDELEKAYKDIDSLSVVDTDENTIPDLCEKENR